MKHLKTDFAQQKSGTLNVQAQSLLCCVSTCVGNMSGMDYASLDEAHAPSRSFLHPVRAAAGLFGMAMAGVAGFAAKAKMFAAGKSDAEVFYSDANGKFVPKNGVESVLAKPSAPGATQFFAPGLLTPASLFVYPSLESKLGPDLMKSANSKPAWLYGAKVEGDGDIAVVTGAKSDVLKGKILTWNFINFPSKLATVDKLLGVGEGTVGKSITDVVLEDGSSKGAYWHSLVPASCGSLNEDDKYTCQVEEAKRNLGNLVAAYRSPIKGNQAEAIGNTPMVKLNKVCGNNAIVYAKVEGRNPAYSVKCRLGAALVYDAEARGLLKPGMTIVEPTSGNTGIALAFVAAAKGYKCILTMPASMSIERRNLMAMLGAKIVLSDAAGGMKGAIAEAERIVASDPEKYFMAQQFENHANVAIHELTTGPEIWQQTNGNIDIFVAGVGTGGTISGVSRYLKNTRHKKIMTVAVEPVHSPVISQTLAGDPLKPGPHKIQGIGAGFVPGNLDLTTLDKVEQVSNDEAIEMAKRLAKEEGLLVGISCGAAAVAAARVANLPENKGKTIVVLLPDLGERYMSTALYEGLEGAVSMAPGA
eukprot:g65053.t1